MYARKPEPPVTLVTQRPQRLDSERPKLTAHWKRLDGKLVCQWLTVY